MISSVMTRWFVLNPEERSDPKGSSPQVLQNEFPRFFDNVWNIERNMNHNDDHSNCLIQICSLQGKRMKSVAPASIQTQTFSAVIAQLDCNVSKVLLLIYFLIRHRGVKRYRVVFYISIRFKRVGGAIRCVLHLNWKKLKKYTSKIIGLQCAHNYFFHFRCTRNTTGGRRVWLLLESG